MMIHGQKQNVNCRKKVNIMYIAFYTFRQLEFYKHIKLLTFSGLNKPSNERLQLLCNRARDMPMGGVGASCSPILSNLRESWSKVSQTTRGLATVFSVTFFCFNDNLVAIVGQLVIRTPPPQQKVSRHITESGTAVIFLGEETHSLFYHLALP